MCSKVWKEVSLLTSTPNKEIMLDGDVNQPLASVTAKIFSYQGG